MWRFCLLLRLGNELAMIYSIFRFNRIVWSKHGNDNDLKYGIIAAGMEDGSLDLWNAGALIEKKFAIL